MSLEIEQPRDPAAPAPAVHVPTRPVSGNGLTHVAAGPAAPGSVSDAKPATRRRLLRRVLPIGLVALLVGVGVGFNAWRDTVLYVSSDNAQITGQPVQVGAMNAGRVDSINPGIGSLVRKGEVLATVSLPSQIGAAQSGTATMGFLGAVDTHVDVTAPFDGVVIATPAPAGSTVQVGQPIVTLIDPTQLWVNANIDETSVDRIQPGQSVIVHVDALKRDVPGRVESVTPATAATFSLIPGQNASGNYNKVTQLIPVRVSLNLGNQPALLGSSVEVKIRVAE